MAIRKKAIPKPVVSFSIKASNPLFFPKNIWPPPPIEPSPSPLLGWRVITTIKMMESTKSNMVKKFNPNTPGDFLRLPVTGISSKLFVKCLSKFLLYTCHVICRSCQSTLLVLAWVYKILAKILAKYINILVEYITSVFYHNLGVCTSFISLDCRMSWPRGKWPLHPGGLQYGVVDYTWPPCPFWRELRSWSARRWSPQQYRR